MMLAIILHLSICFFIGYLFVRNGRLGNYLCDMIFEEDTYSKPPAPKAVTASDPYLVQALREVNGYSDTELRAEFAALESQVHRRERDAEVAAHYDRLKRGIATDGCWCSGCYMIRYPDYVPSPDGDN